MVALGGAFHFEVLSVPGAVSKRAAPLSDPPRAAALEPPKTSQRESGVAASPAPTSSVQSDPRYAQMLTQRAETLIAAHEFENAIPLLEQAVLLDPENTTAREALRSLKAGATPESSPLAKAAKKMPAAVHPAAASKAPQETDADANSTGEKRTPIPAPPMRSSVPATILPGGTSTTSGSEVREKCRDEDRDGYYIGDDPAASACNVLLDFKGTEKAICDCPDLRIGQVCAGAALNKDQIMELFNPDTVAKQLHGRQFHPEVPDLPDNGIDEDCDGRDSPAGTHIVGASPTSANEVGKKCRDEDGDGYYVRDNLPTSACATRLDFRGVEPALCDCPELSIGSLCSGKALYREDIEPIFDPLKVQGKLRGDMFRPDAVEIPQNGIDENCNGGGDSGDPLPDDLALGVSAVHGVPPYRVEPGAPPLAGVRLMPMPNPIYDSGFNRFNVGTLSRQTKIVADIDLHAVDSQGRHVGMNYETGEFEVQIPGCIISGDSNNGSEWIFSPEGATYQYYVSAHDNKTFLDRYPDIAADLADTKKDQEYWINPSTIDWKGTNSAKHVMSSVLPGQADYYSITAGKEPTISKTGGAPAGTTQRGS